MHDTLLIGGKEYRPNPFAGRSSFYPDYTFQLSHPGPLEVSQAIGAVRKADIPALPERAGLLREAAAKFNYSNADVEHCVRMTGMPLRLVAGLFDQVPAIFHEVPERMGARFHSIGKQDPRLAETIGQGLYRVLAPPDGFCYAITPGNDPRAAAIVAANLAYLGFPFILRASIRDTAAPLIIRALIAAGFDPRFSNLIYLDRNGPQAAESHARLASASSAIWTFGPSAAIEPTLRYQQIGQRQDLFEGKTVLRHASGNCAAVTCGQLSEGGRQQLYASIGYPIVCTATKSMMVVDNASWEQQAAEYLHSLVIGDPLDPDTQVGYVEPRYLDYLASLREKNSLRGSFYGGERRSKFQAAPLLVASSEELPDFFAQEIPAYVLAIRPCRDLAEAIAQINHYTGAEPRLAVAFLNFPRQQLSREILSARAHALLVNRSTTTLLPTFHEGNDYALQLSQSRFLSL